MRARRLISNALRMTVVTASTLLVAGCYEDVSPTSPQASKPQPQAPTNQGPITNFGNQGNSALGGAKRAAENIAAQAERKSQEVADQAENPGN